MKKGTAYTIIAIVAAVAVAMFVLFIVSDGKVGSLQADVASRDSDIATLKTDIADKEAKISTLTGDKAQLETDLGTAKETAGKVPGLEKDLKTAQDEAAKVAGLEDELKTAKELADKVPGLEEDLKTAQDEAAKVPGLEADLKTAQDEAAKVPALEADLKTAQEEAAKVPGLEADLKAAQDEAAKAAQAAQGAPAMGRDINLAEVFPSWNPESKSLKELIDFVSDSVDESSPNYIEPADRIATFDMDGTIICEKAPIYVDSCLTMYRVLDDPTYQATEEERAAMQEMRDHAYATGENFKPTTVTKDDLVASAFAGMTPAEFRAYAANFADSVNAVGFEGMTYGQSFYKPMIEVIDYLRANGYDVWMVSACEREVVRALVQRWNIPYDHCIATDVPYVASGNQDKAANDEYNMGKDEKIVLGVPLNEVECGKSGKPAAIAREIGKRPVLAFGNSSGDYSMLNYAEGNPDHPGMGIFVVCDDTEREYGSKEKADGFYAEVEQQGWTAFSMADDWKTIYGDGVEKVGLPGAEEALPDAA